jgi:alpha-galactosidase
MSILPTTRRRFLQLASSAAAAAGAAAAPGARAAEAAGAGLALDDGLLRIAFDRDLRSQVAQSGAGRGTRLHSSWDVAELLDAADGRHLDRFVLSEHSIEAIEDPAHGPGRRLHLVGSAPGLEKAIDVRLFERHPGFACVRVRYRNLGRQALALRGWRNGAYAFAWATGPVPEAWTYSGSTYPDRRDWVQPVRAGFDQENFLGMTGSDYGGGTPVLDLWRKDGGFAVGHVDTVPRQLGLPLQARAGALHCAVVSREAFELAPGAAFETPETFVAAHRGDYFVLLERYRQVMAERGLQAPVPPAVSYEPIWCAWGYERTCTAELIEGTLAKARELGLAWAGIDDGWQNNIGDWRPDPRKYPRGDADMKQLAGRIRAAGLLPRLWYSPLSMAPGSDLLHEHADLLLLDANGAQQPISWWNTFAQCPAYAPTVAQTVALVRKFIGEWGFAGLKLDGQHLNGVAPCFNPAHRHDHPQESCERLHELFRAIYEAARAIDPEVVIELCPCGTSYAFHNFPYVNHAPASDPESAWQVRHKGRTLKALMGPSAAFAGDHVELTPGDDFASTVGVGAVVSTKFTWPVDPKPKDSFLLTPEKEAKWRKWIGIYRDKRLAQGRYRGELYDIAFDRPETHAVEAQGRLHYALYAPQWRGAVELRGLAPGRYRVRDYVNGVDLGMVGPASHRIELAFEHALLIEAIPA